MRNLSMKKFGTLIGAAPRWASVKLGLSVVGAPSAWRPGCGCRRSGLPAAPLSRGPEAGSSLIGTDNRSSVLSWRWVDSSVWLASGRAPDAAVGASPESDSGVVAGVVVG